MGRKRSKTQKKKQNKTATKLAKVFAKKLGVADVDTRMRIETTTTGSSSMDGKSGGNLSTTTKVQQRKPMSSSRKLMDKLSRERLKVSSSSVVGGNNNVPLVSDDFLREQTSLREREMYIEWKRNVTRKSRCSNTGKKQSLQPPIQFTPASFAVTDSEKSVDQLIGETSLKLGNWNGLEEEKKKKNDDEKMTNHNNNNNNNAGRSTPRKQIPIFSTPFSTPIAKSPCGGEDDVAWSPDEMQNGMAKTGSNPWALLADADDDEEEKEEEKKGLKNSIPAFPTISFAQPRFVVASARNTHMAGEIDPDL